MSYVSRFLICALFVLQCPSKSLADPFVQFDGEQVLICAATDLSDSPPAVSLERCEQRDEVQINVHQQTFWVIGEITPPRELIESNDPIGLFVSAKAASRIFLNGHKVAQNGVPGFNRETETPGNIDFVYHVPRMMFQPGANQVAILMSGHHNMIGTTRSALTVGFFPYERAPHHEVSEAFIGMLMLGVFLLSALYTGVLARFGMDRLAPLTLTGTSLLAAGQVISEALRSFWSYPYYVHDLRLLAIIGFGLGVGLTLLAHTLRKFEQSNVMTIMSATSVATLLAVFFVIGFDQKASVAIFVPSVASTLVALVPTRCLNVTRLFYAVAFGLLAIVNIFDPGTFLDTTYFVALAITILFLSVFQATSFVEAVRNSEKSELARRQLEQLLERQNEQEASPLIVRHSGKVERVPIGDIAALEAAGDYVTLKLATGRELLLSRSLSDLEKDLPATFLRVHRSHIVNSDQIKALKRLQGGTGELILNTGAVVPVSRRTMPAVRRSLEKA